MTSSSVNIVQISDIHLFADPDGELLGVKTQDSFQAVLDELKQERNLDLIILSGDLSQDGSEIAYRRVADQIAALNLPTYWVPGNHDDFDVLSQVYPRGTISNHKHIVLADWHIILLNSQIPGSVEGHLDQDQLAYLEKSLQSHPDKHAMVLFHHHPVAVGTKWLDKLGLNNAEMFWEIATRYPRLKHVFFGHVHQEHMQDILGIKAYSPPSTCIQFKPKQTDFHLDKLPPGYRVIELQADGNLKTHIKRAPLYVGKFDELATGY